MRNVNTKPAAYVPEEGVSIDAYAGSWDSKEQFENWWTNTLGSTDPITNGIVIRIVDAAGVATLYKRSADAWVEIGAQQNITASLVEYDSNTTYPAGTIGKAVHDIENNTGADKFPVGTKTAYDAHGLEKGSDIGGMTPYEVLDKILNAEFAPKWTAATASLSIGTTLYEVGSSVPSKDSFVPAGSPAKAEGLTTATGGDVVDGGNALTVDTNTFGVDGAHADFGSEVASQCMIEVELERTYAEGSTQVVTSKGRTTKRTAYNLTTRWDVPEENTQINDSYHIMEDTVTADTDDCAKIYFCYPVWIDEVKQTLAYKKTEYTKDKSLIADANHKITFEIPASYTDVTISYYDTVNRTWVSVDYGTPVAETKTLGTQSYDYKKYTYTDAGLGKVTYKLSFKIA